jgi:predicted secreted hydrolase
MTAAGRHVGFQLTFFRVALSPTAESRESAWGTRQLYVGHFAVTDTANERFHAFSRSSRAALGLAGAQAAPFRVWVEEWSTSGEGEATRLRAQEGDVAIDLTVSPGKPVVLNVQVGLPGAFAGRLSRPARLRHVIDVWQVRLGIDVVTDFHPRMLAVGRDVTK